MRNEVNPNVANNIAQSQAVKDVLYDYAKRAAHLARVNAPKRTHHYVASIFAERNPAGYPFYGSRDFKAWWIEFGAAGKAGKRPLINAAKALRMRIDLRRGP